MWLIDEAHGRLIKTLDARVRVAGDRRPATGTPLGGVLPGMFAESHWSESMGVTGPRSTELQVQLADRILRVRAATGCPRRAPADGSAYERDRPWCWTAVVRLARWSSTGVS